MQERTLVILFSLLLALVSPASQADSVEEINGSSAVALDRLAHQPRRQHLQLDARLPLHSDIPRAA